MENNQIHALETRYKATALMLINLELMEGKIDELMGYGHMAFDSEKYDMCAKILDLVGVEVIAKLEILDTKEN